MVTTPLWNYMNLNLDAVVQVTHSLHIELQDC